MSRKNEEGEFVTAWDLVEQDKLFKSLNDAQDQTNWHRLKLIWMELKQTSNNFDDLPSLEHVLQALKVTKGLKSSMVEYKGKKCFELGLYLVIHARIKSLEQKASEFINKGDF